MAVTWKKLAYEDDVITKALLTATGDIIYATAASTPGVLAVGTNGHILTLAAGVPSWAAAPAAAHAASHKDGQSDELLLHELGEPTAAVDFNGYQGENLVVHTVANSGARPAAVVGKVCFQSDTLGLYACTVAS